MANSKPAAAAHSGGRQATVSRRVLSPPFSDHDLSPMKEAIIVVFVFILIWGLSRTIGFLWERSKQFAFGTTARANNKPLFDYIADNIDAIRANVARQSNRK